MSLVLVRVDDRLIHGQVVVGWGQAIRPDRIVLVDDEIAGNPGEQELYSAGVPARVEVEFATIAGATTRVEEWAESSDRVLILIGDVESLVRLCRHAPAIRKVNLGGLHQAAGRSECLPYVFLTEAEGRQLAELAAQGVEITAQDLPTATPVTLAELVA